jgi:hypothetical protein
MHTSGPSADGAIPPMAAPAVQQPSHPCQLPADCCAPARPAASSANPATTAAVRVNTTLRFMSPSICVILVKA